MHPGFTDFTNSVARAFGEGLSKAGWRVELTTASTNAPTDLSGLDLLVLIRLIDRLVTALASWIGTSTPRLSFFGMQLALVFYIVNLSEFAPQTSLLIGRDRVVGVVLGITIMWLVYDRLLGASAVVEMKRSFIGNLRSLAELAREPRSDDRQAARARISSLRDTISNGFDHVRAIADGVVLEFGPSRPMGLALRSQIIRVQPELRVLFITLVATWRYRMQRPGFELPAPVATAQREFDDHVAMALLAMADRMEGRSSTKDPSLGSWTERLERMVETNRPPESQEPSAPQLQAFLSLHHRIEDLVISLNEEI